MQNYDAREGGGFPEPPAPPLICAEESCKPAPTAPPQGAAPATPSFQGPGNQTHKPKPKKPKQSHKHKKKTNKHEKKGAKNR